MRLTITPDHWEEVLSALRALLEPIRVMRGCVSFRVYCDLEDEHTVLIVEQWATETDLARHVAGRDFRRILAVLELAAETPSVEISTVSTCRGMELIEGLREEPRE